MAPMRLLSSRFERLVSEEFALVPAHFARRIENLALTIEEEPSEEVRAQEELLADETLLGLYQGVPLSERGAHYGEGVTLPDTITLYRRPLFEEAERLLGEGRTMTFEEAVRLAIRETLWHEIGHHFGLEEGDVRAREIKRTNHY